MKPNLIKSTLFANGWRCLAVLLATACLIWVAFISSSAQLKTQKHVTSLQLGQAAEGARVTVTSDGALNDYEAFRRGDRFYVKIPLAEFAFSQPRFHGNGFDDVQVQKVGDSVVVSFKLQLGASARVEQRGNRLDVIFTALNRSQHGNIANVASNRAPSGPNENKGNQGNQDRQRDAAGPVPSDGPLVSRERYANGHGPEAALAQRQPRRNVRVENHQNRTSPGNNAPLASATPRYVASPTPVPNYPAASSYKPATSTPLPSSKPVGVYTNSPNSNKVRDWFLANRNAALLAVLILAGLLALLAAFLYRGRTTKATEKPANRPLAQPKYDSKVELDELTASPAERGPSVAEPISQAATKSEWSRVTPKPAFAPAAEVAASHAAVPSNPSVASVVADNKTVSEEREVFEL
jgi:hypothetical protein